VMAAEGLPVQLACRVLEGSESGYYARRSRAPSARFLRHVWLTEMIRQVHSASRGTYGIRRSGSTRAELAGGFLSLPVCQTYLRRAGGICALEPAWGRSLF
jgi:hypothetical protein